MSAFTLVVVAMTATAHGGSVVGVRNDPMPSYAHCQQQIHATHHYYRVHKPHARIISADCIPSGPPAATIYRESREWITQPYQPQPHYAPPHIQHYAPHVEPHYALPHQAPHYDHYRRYQ